MVKKKKDNEAYAENYKSGKWQAKRLEIFQRDGFKCRCCKSEDNQHVHHLYYNKDKKPWEYGNEVLVTLCGDCHKRVHSAKILKTAGIIAFKLLTGELVIEEPKEG